MRLTPLMPLRASCLLFIAGVLSAALATAPASARPPDDHPNHHPGGPIPNVHREHAPVVNNDDNGVAFLDPTVVAPDIAPASDQPVNILGTAVQDGDSIHLESKDRQLDRTPADARSDPSVGSESQNRPSSNVVVASDVVRAALGLPGMSLPANSGSAPNPQSSLERSIQRLLSSSAEFLKLPNFYSTAPESSKTALSLENMVAEAEARYSEDGDQQGALRLFRAAALLGHAGAMATVGTLLSSGDTNITRDLASAVRFLRMASVKGQPDALALLGFLHASGIADRYGIEKNDGKAILYWTLAADTGSVAAEMAVGYRYLYGIGVMKSCLLAGHYYRRAARAIATDDRYMPSLENFFSSNPPIPSGLKVEDRVRLTDDILDVDGAAVATDSELVEYYRLLASQGDPEHLTTIGGLQLFGGNGLEPDEDRARADLERAAFMGDGQAHGMLAHLALNRNDNSSALHHFAKSAAASDRMGFYGLGMMYLHGIGVEMDRLAAAKYFKAAVEKQHPDAAYHLGMMYFRGDGVQKNVAEAYRLFQIAARLGQIQAKMNMGLMLLDGVFPVGEPDCHQGVLHLKAVAESGEWKSVLTVAADHVESGDMFGALYRFMQAGYVGIEVAQYNAALLLEKGAAEVLGSFNSPWAIEPLGSSEELGHWDADRMLRAAFELYEMSADQGYSASLLRMGDVAYSEVNDFRTAAQAYQKGADMRNAEATFSLGWMYAVGLGVAADRGLAVRYFEMSKRYSPEAVIPATLALFTARVAWGLVDTLDWMLGRESRPLVWTLRSLLDKSAARPWGDGGHGVADRLFELPLDVVLVISLVGLLALILFVRRRRMEVSIQEGEE